ncbi:MAG: hypothetical protein Hens3KO_24130 [Henriciella sp.]
MTQATQPYLQLIGAPALIIDRAGNILDLNRQARTLLSGIDIGISLKRLSVDGAATLSTLLEHSEQTTASLPFQLELEINGKSFLLNGTCKCLTRDGEEPLFGLVQEAHSLGHFVALNNKIELLNSEIAMRKDVQAKLEQALTKNQFLLSELQHRVLNNIQIQISLLDQQALHADDERFKELANKANQRLCALSQSLKVMYNDEGLSHVSAAQLFADILGHLRNTFGDKTEIEFQASGEWLIPNDFVNAYALLLNELMTNAFMHGLQGKPGKIVVDLFQKDHDIILEVSDPGPGFGRRDHDKGSFGLNIIYGLCSQVGARFEIDYNDGCICRLIVSNPSKVDLGKVGMNAA